MALTSLGHECVFACESDPELRELYRLNYPDARSVRGDIRNSKDAVPEHDILCAGFPCQPFSKSGTQSGLKDKTRGTLFHEIVDILATHQPPFVILENVGNFELHDGGRTWRIVRDSLSELGYQVRATEHVKSNGHGLVSPHHLGYPHTRERFFVVASSNALPEDPFPPRHRRRKTTLAGLVQAKDELSAQDNLEVGLSKDQIACIDHWNQFIQNIPDEQPLPSFPIWGDEIYARYPFAARTPFACSTDELLAMLRLNGKHREHTKQELLSLLPSYARSEVARFPRWKQAYLRQNRRWFRNIQPFFPEAGSEHFVALYRPSENWNGIVRVKRATLAVRLAVSAFRPQSETLRRLSRTRCHDHYTDSRSRPGAAIPNTHRRPAPSGLSRRAPSSEVASPRVSCTWQCCARWRCTGGSRRTAR